MSDDHKFTKTLAKVTDRSDGGQSHPKPKDSQQHEQHAQHAQRTWAES